MTPDSTFPSGQLYVREFRTITEAHAFASEISDSVRLVDLSPTAGGAWVCAWTAPGESVSLTAKFQNTAIEVDAKFMNALLSLGPKPNDSTTHIGIVESESIHEVFQTAVAYAGSSATLLEIRVKRAGPVKGAYAFFALESAAPPAPMRGDTPTKLTPMTVVPLINDYRRYFL